MLDENPAATEAEGETQRPVKKTTAKKTARRTTKKAVAAEQPSSPEGDQSAAPADAEEPAKKAAAKKAPVKKAATKKTAAKKTTAKKAPAKKAAAKKSAAKQLDEAAPEAAADPAPADAVELPDPAPAAEKPVKKAAKRAPRKKAVKAVDATTAAAPEAPVEELAPVDVVTEGSPQAASADETAAPVKKAPARRTRAKKAAPAVKADETGQTEESAAEDTEAAAVPLFQAPTAATRRSRSRKKAEAPVADEVVDEQDVAEEPAVEPEAAVETTAPPATDEDADAATADDNADETASADSEQVAEGDGDGDNDQNGEGQGSGRRRRRRGGRRRRRGGAGNDEQNEVDDSGDEQDAEKSDVDSADDSAEAGNGEEEQGEGGSSRRRRRRRRAGDNSGDAADDPTNTVTKVRQGRSAEDQITAVSGSTRLEAKKQRRREGREAGRRRAPIVSEAEFLARREAVDRVMVVRQKGELTQIGVLEDKVLVEHYVSRESQNSLIGNVYLGRVQNVLPSMEAAFVDIGKGRNAVLYAGEVNWSALGHKEGQPRKIESVLSSGQSVLVQVTKDPIGHKGARLTSQVSLAGRFLVYVPDGTTAGISRKLPDTERARLKGLLKEIVPDAAGVIVRTAAEGASEAELTQDVERLKARWDDIEAKSKQGSGPKLLYGEPDLTLKVVRDLFTEDFAKLVVEGGEAWNTVRDYVEHVAPDLLDRVERFVAGDGGDSFAVHRIDEQIAKGLDRKVWLPSGGSLVIDRTEAMTVVDVNTGKFTGSGGNLEETVTKNNLEAAEEIVRQLRLRDIGGIIVVDFIDMVLESNRDLVLRRLVECLGRDRTRHQVAEVTSLGLVQMTRKRIGTGLLEAFSETCEHCQGRGLTVRDMPIESGRHDDEPRRGRKGGRSKGEQPRNDQSRNDQGNKQKPTPPVPTPAAVAAVARPDVETDEKQAEQATDETTGQTPEPAVEQTTDTVRKSGRRSRNTQRTASVVDEPVTGSAVDEQAPVAAVDVSVPASVEPAATTAATPAPEASEPAAPKVSTVTRARRSARSGVITPKQADPVVVPETAPTVAAPVASAPPPKVVTRSRRRTSTPDASSVETEQHEDADQADLHVPVKKRGGRKR